MHECSQRGASSCRTSSLARDLAQELRAELEVQILHGIMQPIEAGHIQHFSQRRGQHCEFIDRRQILSFE